MDAIGKYTILEVIGRGGMGTVYRAHDPVIGRDVAIKVIAEHVASLPKVKERLYQEATSAGRLSHENIMTIFDIGETDGTPYLVMELLDGKDLRSTLDSNKTLTFERKIDLAIQICRALEYAHARGVVHRDIKPENIRILSSGRVKILDFGIARVESETRTMTNTSIGTPRYMSPEQVRGKEVDQRTDIFSFGVLLYELLSGVNPFDGTHVTAVIYKILHEQPEPIHLDDEHLAADVQRLVGRCLEKEADKRYPDFTEVIRDLRDILAKRQSGAPTLLDEGAAKAAADAAAAAATAGPEEDVNEVPRWRRLPVFEAVANSGPQTTEAGTDGTQRLPSRRPAWLIPAGAAVLVMVLVGGYLLLQSGASSDADLTTSTSTAAVDLQEVGLTALRNFALKLADEVEAEKVNAEPWKDSESLSALYQEAADSERVAIEAMEVGSSEAYQRAAGALLVARNTLRAIAAAGNSDAAELRQDAEEARQAMDRARRQVQGQRNSPLVSDVVERAESNRRQGESQFEAGEYTTARISFSQAEAGYIDARRTLERAATTEQQQQRRAEAARTAVDQRRQAVYAWREAPANAAAFQEAERLRTEGVRLADTGRFEDAIAQFGRAEDAYSKVKEPVVAAPAENSSAADLARGAAEASRERVPEQHRTHARYTEAESILQNAQRAYARNDFAASADLFENAERLYSEVAALPVPVSPEAAARAGIEPLLERFKNGLQNEDAATLRSLHSFLGAYSAMFDVAEDIRADISYSDLNVAGDRATASVLVQMRYKNKTQRMRQENQSVRLRWTLEESADGAWQLRDVAPL